MTIHAEHPFADPDIDHARRFRARLGGQVSLWTTGEGDARTGLTISSLLLAAGEPTSVIGLLDPDSDLVEQLTRESADGPARAVVSLLEWRHRDLAEQFAGRMPAPGGRFAQAAWVQTDAGPRLADAETWAEVTVLDRREVGWSMEVTARVDALVVGAADDALLHRRGRYGRVDPDAARP